MLPPNRMNAYPAVKCSVRGTSTVQRETAPVRPVPAGRCRAAQLAAAYDIHSASPGGGGGGGGGSSSSSSRSPKICSNDDRRISSVATSADGAVVSLLAVRFASFSAATIFFYPFPYPSSAFRSTSETASEHFSLAHLTRRGELIVGLLSRDLDLLLG